MKKLLLVVVLAVLITSMFITETFALDYSDVNKYYDTEVLEVMKVYEIMNGFSDNTFRPGNKVTRGEFAKIGITLLGYRDVLGEVDSSFDDMENHWAESYVDLIDGLDILTAYEDNTFRPNEFISYDEALRGILIILGYNDSVIESSTYENYNVLAKEIGLLENESNNYVLTRYSLATLIHKSLSENTVDIEGGRIIENKSKLIDNLGSLENIKIDDEFALEHPYIDFSPYYFNIASVYFDLNGKILLITDLSYEVIEGDVMSVISDEVVFVKNETSSTELYDLTDVPIIFNGIESKISEEDLKNSYIKIVIDKETDLIIGAVVSKSTSYALVEEKYSDGDTTFEDVYLPTERGIVSKEHIKISGAVDDIYEIKEGDVVYFYETNESRYDKSTLIIEVVRKTVEGKFEGNTLIDYNHVFIIDGIEYYLSENFILNDEVVVDDTVKLHLDKENKIVLLKVTEFITEPSTYGLLIDVKNNNEELPEIELIDQNGQTKNYILKDNCGIVTQEYIDNEIIYSVSINPGEFIKFDELNENTIKIAKPVDGVYLNGELTESFYSYAIGNSNVRIDASTLIVMENGDSFRIREMADLADIIYGEAIVLNNNVAYMILVERNLVKEIEEIEDAEDVDDVIEIDGDEIDTEDDSETIPQFEQAESINLKYTAIKSIEELTDEYIVEFFNANEEYHTENKNIRIDSFVNMLLLVETKDDMIVSIEKIRPDIPNSKMTAIFQNQLQIDGLSYVEYHEDSMIFICSTDELGNFDAFEIGSIEDLTVDSTIQMYDLNNSYSGVMDTIVVFK